MFDDTRSADPVGPLDAVLARLPSAKAAGGQWTARCPAHEDRHPSLSVALGDDVGVLVHCFAGCSRAAIVAALGLHERDLRPQGTMNRRVPVPAERASSGDGDTVGLTLASLAAAKRLPLDFLRSLGCSTAGGAVRIPYYDTRGDEATVRLRLAQSGDRFRWRRGDRAIPYGLWRLPDARTAGWVLLVEGETDCWTLWHAGLPALGVPGKTSWRAEWADLVSGLEVALWQEPGAEDLTERVARDLPALKVIVAPSGIKDPSDARVQGLDVTALVDRLHDAAVPARELLDRRHRQRRIQTHRQAASVLAHPNPLLLVEAELAAQGYGGDLRAPLLAYLAATTRLLPTRRGSMPAHLLFIGPSSSGKNAAMEAALRLLPDDAVHVIDAGSPRVLIYDDAPLEHRVVVFSEADSLPAGEDNPAASAIRNLLQDGYLHYQVTLRDPATGGYTVHKVDKPGPTVLMTTSTKPLGHQLMTRLFKVDVPDEPAQIRAALAAQAALELDGPPAPDDALVAFQAYLGSLAPIDVVVPFARALQSSLGAQPGGPRVLRDYPRLLSLVKAAALVRSGHRTTDHSGRLVAVVDDYRTVHGLLADTYAASAGAGVRVRETVAAVEALIAEKGPGSTATATEVAERLGISIPSGWRRVQDALAGKWLVNDEHRGSQKARLRVGEPLPAEAGLPAPEAIEEDASADATDGEPRVFTIAPHPVVSRPTPTAASGIDGHQATVKAENAKTPDPDAPMAPVPLYFGIFGDDDEDWGLGTA